MCSKESIAGIIDASNCHTHMRQLCIIIHSGEILKKLSYRMKKKCECSACR
jgi:hypothetical protein